MQLSSVIDIAFWMTLSILKGLSQIVRCWKLFTTFIQPLHKAANAHRNTCKKANQQEYNVKIMFFLQKCSPFEASSILWRVFFSVTRRDERIASLPKGKRDFTFHIDSFLGESSPFVGFLFRCATQPTVEQSVTVVRMMLYL